MSEFRRRLIRNGEGKYIKFKDPIVAKICAEKWGDGIGITPEQTAEVTSIGTIFKGNTEITSFDELEKFGIQSIGQNSFSGCSSLQSVKWKEGITMGISALQGAGITGKLDLSTISNTTIPNNMCYNCSRLEEVIIGENVVGIDGSFKSCTALKKVTIRSNSLNIMSNSFDNCPALEIIEIPNTVEVFSGVFNACKNLVIDTNIISNAKTLSGYAFRNTGLYGVVDCPNLETLSSAVFSGSKITGVKNLGKITAISGSYPYTPFYACYSLEYVHLPITLTSIAKSSFQGCSVLKCVTLASTTPPTLGTNVFYGTPSTMLIYVPDESVETYKSAENWSAYADRIKPISEYVEPNE